MHGEGGMAWRGYIYDRGHGGGGVHGGGVCMAGDVCVACMVGACVAGGHAWQGCIHRGCVAGGHGGACVQERWPLKRNGMHPTGMHSCVYLILFFTHFQESSNDVRMRQICMHKKYKCTHLNVSGQIHIKFWKFL